MSKRRSIPAYYFSVEWKTLRKAVLERDKYKCAYCGKTANQADHVIPRGRGGPDSLSNLAAACQSCNRIARGRLFPNMDKKREYIMQHRQKEYRRRKRKKWAAIFGDWR